MMEINNRINNVSFSSRNERLPKSRRFGVTSFFDNGKTPKQTPDTLFFHSETFSEYFNYEYFHVLNKFCDIKNNFTIVDRIERAGLHGCGGAHFPTAAKWKAALNHNGPRYLVVNAQEGEKHTFKDFMLMQKYPHQVVEGAVLSALAIQAKQVFIMVNSAYKTCFLPLQQAVDDFRKGFPDLNVEVTIAAGPDPDLYVCGEETALIQYMNNRRAEPQIRPPFPFQEGYKGKPTVIQNVETICWIPVLLDRPNLFKEKGELKLVHIWGSVNRPGIYEVTVGTRLNDLLDIAGKARKGDTLTAIEVGGMAGGMLPASMGHLRLEHESMRNSGAMVGTGSVRFLCHRDNLLELSKQATEFFREESCGRCTACRVGTQVLTQMIELVEHGVTDRSTRERIDDVASTLTNASLCSLGKGAPSHFLSYLRYWG